MSALSWLMAATRPLVAWRRVVSSTRRASRSPRRRGSVWCWWPRVSRAAPTASIASVLAPVRRAGRLGRQASTTRSPWVCSNAVSPAPELPAPSTAQQRRAGPLGVWVSANSRSC